MLWCSATKFFTLDIEFYLKGFQGNMTIDLWTLQWSFTKRTNAYQYYRKASKLGGSWGFCRWTMGGVKFILVSPLILSIFPCFKILCCSHTLIYDGDLYKFLQLPIALFYDLGFSFLWHVVMLIQCFLLQLINSSQANRPSNISSSTMKVFQHGLLSQR